VTAALPRHGLSAALACLLLTFSSPLWAELKTVDGTLGVPVSAAVTLDFEVRIEKMLFLRVGTGSSYSGIASGTGPAASASRSNVTLNWVPGIPAVPTTPVAGNKTATNWNGASPSQLASTAVSLPVEVRSNAGGTVTLTAQMATALSNGTDTLPASSIVITSSDSTNLPAPVVGSATGVSVAVGGPGTAAAPALLTYRTATWDFNLATVTQPLPGIYNGVITFTATAP
jgi:hypothetical protein